MRRWTVWLPLAGFALVALLVGLQLRVPPNAPIQSRLVGKPLPDFALLAAVPGTPGLASAGFRTGHPRLLNVFASWCVPCVAEAPQLLALRRAGARIDGIAIRDRPEDVADFLRRNGNPYAAIGGDARSEVQLALGSAGVPETFVIDGRGRIAAQHIGVITEDDVPVLLQALEAAR